MTFYSLAECNAAITLVMQRMNERLMRNLGLSRRELFETIERDALTALPADDWRVRRSTSRPKESRGDVVSPAEPEGSSASTKGSGPACHPAAL